MNKSYIQKHEFFMHILFKTKKFKFEKENK